MNYSNYRITLDIRKTVASVQLTAKKGDTGRKIYITLSDNGNPCQIGAGCYAVFAGKKPDGNLLYNKAIIEDNTIIYEMTRQTTAVAGLVSCEVKLFDSMSNLLTSPKLTILVDDVVLEDEEIVSANEVTALVELINEATVTIELGNKATDNCNTAAEAANTAAQSANGSAAAATNAAATANIAAGNVTAQGNAALAAANTANNAAALVNQAVAAAGEATKNANTAAAETIKAKEEFIAQGNEFLETVHGAATENSPGIVCNVSGEIVHLPYASNRVLQGLTIYGKTTQNGTPTPNNPVELVSVGASGAIKTTVCGKNLLPNTANTQTINGVTFTVNEDGRITVNGTASATASMAISPSSFDIPNGNYWYSGGGGSRECYSYVIYDENRYANDYTGQGSAVNVTTGKIAYCGIKVNAGATVSNVVFHPQIEDGETATAYEPYKPIQTLTASAPNGLPGIPVSSGGNYIDASGQQWICDEIDFARGVYVQRLGQVYIDGSSAPAGILGRTNSVRVHYKGYPNGSTQYNDKSMCNRFKYETVWSVDAIGMFKSIDNTGSFIMGLPLEAGTTNSSVQAWLAEHPVHCIYVMETPIETPLSADELAAYYALHTNKPNTTVYNDAGAHMELSYVADTKMYIDNKVSGILSATVE